MRIIPDEVLSRLATDTKVDYYSKVLSGERMFHLLLYAFCMTDRISQRRVETMFNSQQFKTLFDYAEGMTVSRSSISTRLSKMNVEFFEKAYEYVYAEMSALYTEEELGKKQLVRVDSSMVAEACNKLKKGFSVGKKPNKGESRKQVKYTMGYDGFAVKLADIFSDPTYLSEDRAMPAVVTEMIKKDKDHTNIYVLDRGLAAVYNYEGITERNAVFIGRLKTGCKMEVVCSLMRAGTEKNLGKLELTDDLEVKLYDRGSKQFTERTYRVVKARFKEPRDTTRSSAKGKHPRVENDIYFITNDFDLSTQEIAEAYRRRWDIEVFFRFLKQELNFSHFLSVSENGLRIILYMTLITAVMIMIYKRRNGMGYSEAKFSFRIEMSDYIMVLGIFLSGGDTSKYAHRYKIRDSVSSVPYKSFDRSWFQIPNKRQAHRPVVVRASPAARLLLHQLHNPARTEERGHPLATFPMDSPTTPAPLPLLPLGLHFHTLPALCPALSALRHSIQCHDTVLLLCPT